MLKALTGIVTATPTPLLPDGSLDRRSAQELVRYLLAAGTRAIAPIGGTGEYVSLSGAQRVAMVEATAEAVDHAVPVVAGMVSPGLGDALTQAPALLAAGADGLLVTTPFYHRPTQAGIVDYFKMLSDRVDADLVLYEFPFRTGVSLTADTVARLADETRIVAMKACNADLSQQMRVMAAAGEKISILSGDEDVYPLHVAMGARGGLLASCCLFPRVWNRIHALASGGQLEGALALHRTIRPALDALFAEHNPGPLKAALAAAGRPAGGVLPPLRDCSEELRPRLMAALAPVLALEHDLEKTAAAE